MHHDTRHIAQVQSTPVRDTQTSLWKSLHKPIIEYLGARLFIRDARRDTLLVGQGRSCGCKGSMGDRAMLCAPSTAVMCGRTNCRSQIFPDYCRVAVFKFGRLTA